MSYLGKGWADELGRKELSKLRAVIEQTIGRRGRTKARAQETNEVMLEEDRRDYCTGCAQVAYEESVAGAAVGIDQMSENVHLAGKDGQEQEGGMNVEGGGGGDVGSRHSMRLEKKSGGIRLQSWLKTRRDVADWFAQLDLMPCLKENGIGGSFVDAVADSVLRYVAFAPWLVAHMGETYCAEGQDTRGTVHAGGDSGGGRVRHKDRAIRCLGCGGPHMVGHLYAEEGRLATHLHYSATPYSHVARRRDHPVTQTLHAVDHPGCPWHVHCSRSPSLAHRPHSPLLAHRPRYPSLANRCRYPLPLAHRRRYPLHVHRPRYPLLVHLPSMSRQPVATLVK